MRIDWWTLGLQAVNVLVLVWLLKRFLFSPVAAIIAERQAAAARLLAEAQARRDEAAAREEEAEKEAAALAGSRNEAMKAAQADVERQRAALLAEAQAETDRLRAACRAELAQARQDEAAASADRASRLALDIAARLLDRLPAEQRIAGFIDGLAAALASLPAQALTGLGADGPVRVKAPRPLTEAEAATCRAAIGNVLGRPIDIAVAVDPGLVAGLEIDSAHIVVRNSFRDDLDRLATELTRHD